MVSSETKWWPRKVCAECRKVCAEAGKVCCEVEKVCGELKSLCCKFLEKTQFIEGPSAKDRLRSLCCKNESLWCIIINVTFDRHIIVDCDGAIHSIPNDGWSHLASEFLPGDQMCCVWT
jgi:hypothetical protein